MSGARLTQGALVAVYLAAVVAANLLAARFGPTVTVYNAFGLIGLDLITRDRLADFWGTNRWAKMAALIGAGSLLSFIVNKGAGTIAVASAGAFACAEAGEGILYYALRGRRWMHRANAAAWLGAAIDSMIFPTMAFGTVLWATTFGQFTAKTTGGLFWSVVVARVKPGKGS